MRFTLLAKATHNKLQKCKGYFGLKSHTPPCSFDLWLQKVQIVKRTVGEKKIKYIYIFLIYFLLLFQCLLLVHDYLISLCHSMSSM